MLDSTAKLSLGISQQTFQLRVALLGSSQCLNRLADQLLLTSMPDLRDTPFHASSVLASAASNSHMERNCSVHIVKGIDAAILADSMYSLLLARQCHTCNRRHGTSFLLVDLASCLPSRSRSLSSVPCKVFSCALRL